MRLPAVRRQPVLPNFVHVYVDDRVGPSPPSNWHLGMQAKDVLLRSSGFELNTAYLRQRGLETCPKVLLVWGEDEFLEPFCYGVGASFFASINRPDITAIICPNLSAYPHAMHRIWLRNRAINQIIMMGLLAHGLPGVLHTYIGDSTTDREWLVTYLSLNRSQRFIATGFENGGCRNRDFVKRTLERLAGVEAEVGRCLEVVLGSIMMELGSVRMATDFFPGRVHFVSASLAQKSTHGCLLKDFDGDKFVWQPNAKDIERGLPLFALNRRRFDAIVRREVPGLHGEEPSAADCLVVGPPNQRPSRPRIEVRSVTRAASSSWALPLWESLREHRAARSGGEAVGTGRARIATRRPQQG